MIIYFTGTGNSIFVADALAHKLGDETISMNDLIKNNGCRSFESDRPYVIVCPIYAWRIPRAVDQFIEESEFRGNKKIYVVVTMGAEPGKASDYVSETLSEKDVEFMGFSGIPMTDNFVNWSKMPGSDEIKETNAKALILVDDLAKKISAGEKIECVSRTRMAGIKSGYINRMFNKHMSNPSFSVSDSCIGCGKCADFCPANNITMNECRPEFAKECFCCYGCLHRCPKAAIDIKGKVAKNGQFVCPDYGE